MIDPATNKEGETFEAYNQRRWGTSAWTNRLKDQGRKDGAMFQNWKWWPNTLDAHRLVLFASARGVDTSTSNAALFEAIYEQGENISLQETLLNTGTGKLGLNREELQSFLESNAGVGEVEQEIVQGRQRYSVSSVPFFVVGPEDGSKKSHGIAGAQSSQTLKELFQKVSGGE